MCIEGTLKCPIKLLHSAPNIKFPSVPPLLADGSCTGFGNVLDAGSAKISEMQWGEMPLKLANIRCGVGAGGRVLSHVRRAASCVHTVTSMMVASVLRRLVLPSG